MIDPEKIDLYKKLSPVENLELHKIILTKTVLSTKIEDWRSPPKDFVAVSIPIQLQEFVALFPDSQAALSVIITDLVTAGIGAIAVKHNSIELLDAQISSILQSEETKQ